jgi:hypothetical protein
MCGGLRKGGWMDAGEMKDEDLERRVGGVGLN